MILLKDKGVGLIDSSEQCCHGRVGVERDRIWLHDFWQFLSRILGMSLVQELVITAPGISGIRGRGLPVPEAQVTLKVRVFLDSINLSSRGKNGLSRHVNIIIVGHDKRDGS